MLLERFIAFRYLRSPRADKSISVITVISIIGVALGVATLIVVLSIMNGFDRDLRSALIGVNSHVNIGVFSLDTTQELSFDDEMTEKINRVINYESATPYTVNQALINSSFSQKGAHVRGVDGKKEQLNKSFLPYFKKRQDDPQPKPGDLEPIEVFNSLKPQLIEMEDGDSEPLNLPGIILGSALARNLGVDYGSIVELISLKEKISPLGSLPRIKKFQVRGIFGSGLVGYDELMAYIDIDYSQKFFSMGDSISGISINLADPNLAEKAKRSLNQVLNFPYYVRTWMEDNANLFLVIQLEKLGLSVILSLIIMIAAANIVGSLIMLVIEKKKDIAILKAMGIKNSSIRRIFVYQGAAVGLSGTVIGELLGIGLSLLIKNYEIIEIPEGVYIGNKIPLYIDIWHLMAIGAVSVLICLLVTIYPSTKGAKVDPIEGLRND